MYTHGSNSDNIVSGHNNMYF